MKKFKVNSETQKGRPFWLPWGIFGVIWRFLVFLAMLIGILFLLKALLETPGPDWSADWFGGHDDTKEVNPVPDNRYKDMDPDEFYNLPEDPFFEDDYPGRTIDPDDIDVNDPIDDIIDVPDDRRITNPDNPYEKIADYKLNIILDDHGDESLFEQFLNDLAHVSANIKIENFDPVSRTVQIIVPPAMRQQVIETLHEMLPDYDFYIFEEAFFDELANKNYNDPGLKNVDQSWYFDAVQAYDAWEITKGSPDVTVAIIDSYIDIDHPELKDHKIVNPMNFDNGSKRPNPPTNRYTEEDAEIYHGTHVTGLAVGSLNNGEGVAGIAPDVTLMPIALGKQMTSMKMVRAVLSAINRKANVINLSIGTGFDENAQYVPIADQLEYIETYGTRAAEVWDYVFGIADKRNVTIVWAAGNYNVLAGLDETKRNDTTIRVSAVDRNLNTADFSNYGYDPEQQGTTELLYSDISAPGVEIFNAAPGNSYITIDGTSMAAPIVTGAVALIKSVNPELTNAQIISLLKRTGRELNDPRVGRLLQIKDALIEAGAGEDINYDDIIKDPSQLTGVWKTTEKLNAVDAVTNAPLNYQTHIYLEFNSPNGGRVRIESDLGDIYTAPFTCKIQGKNIIIAQQGNAISKTNPHPFIPETYTCERASDGRLLGHATSGYDTYFKRIK